MFNNNKKQITGQKFVQKSEALFSFAQTFIAKAEAINEEGYLAMKANKEAIKSLEEENEVIAARTEKNTNALTKIKELFN